jgi:hypothetical protein
MAGSAGVMMSANVPQYDPLSNTWTYNGKRYANQGDALASQYPNAVPTPDASTAPGALSFSRASLPASLQSLSLAASPGQAAADASARAADISRAQGNLDADRALTASESAAQRALTASEGGADRAQQLARDAANAGYSSTAAREDDARAAAESALARAFQTSTTATGVQTSRENQDRMMAYIAPFLSSFLGSGSSAPGGGTSSTSAAASGGGIVTPPADDDALAGAARTAAFNRAKDQTADLARSSLMTLRAAGAERGVNVAGGTNPALLSEESRTLSAANRPLSDLVRQQAVDTSTRADSVADRNYQGNIALQGQKAALAPSLLSLLKVGGLY